MIYGVLAIAEVALLARDKGKTTSRRLSNAGANYTKVRKEAYGTARPQCASNLIGVTRLAFPEQLIEITFKAMLSEAEAKPR